MRFEMKKSDVDAMINLLYTTITTIEIMKSRTPAEAAAKQLVIKEAFVLLQKISDYATTHTYRQATTDLRNRLNRAMKL